MKKIHLKILAVLCAVILWFIVITVENSVYQIPVSFAVQPENQEKNISLVQPLPEIKIYVTAEKETAQALGESDFEVTVDLRQAVIGENSLPVEITTTKNDVRILKTVPERITVKLAPLAEKEVPVTVRVNGEPAKDYTVKETVPQYKVIKISGAQSVLDAIESVEAELILDGTQTADVNQNVPVKLSLEYEPLGKIITLDPVEMLVKAVITSEIEEKEVPIVPGFRSEEEKTAWGNRVTMIPESIKIRGNREILSEVTGIETEPFEFSAITRGKETEVKLKLPEGVTLADPTLKPVVIIPPDEEAEGEVQGESVENEGF